MKIITVDHGEILIFNADKNDLVSGYHLIIRKRKLTFLRYLLRKEGQENLTLTRHIECDKDRDNQQVTVVDSEMEFGLQ